MAREVERRAPPLTRRVPHARTGHVYTGLNITHLHPAETGVRCAARRPLGIADEVRAIGHIGVFNENENQPELIEKVLPGAPLRDHRGARVWCPDHPH